MSVEININNDVVEINEVNEVVQIVVSGGIGPAGPQGPAGTGTVNSINLTAGTGISVSGGPITVSGNINVVNTAPDQVVALTPSTGIAISGTYPNFTITNSAPSSGGTVTSVGLSSATSGVTIGSTPVTTSGTLTLAIATATTSQNGLLSSADFTTFNNKQGTISLTTTGTSGAATFSANTLNIPQYSGTNIYNANGSLTSARTLTHAGFNLSLVGSVHTNVFSTTGRVLLGNPTESTFLLDVNGTARVSGLSFFNSLLTANANITSLSSSIFGTPFISIKSVDLANPTFDREWQIKKYAHSALSTSQGLAIVDVTSASERMVFFAGSSNGVGINTGVNNGHGLEVNGSVKSGQINTTNLFLDNGSITDFRMPNFMLRGFSNDIRIEIGLTMIGYISSVNKNIVFSNQDLGGGGADGSSAFEVRSTTKGFLPPRMTTVQINAIVTPAEGLMAYNTTLSHLCVYQAGAWAKLSHSPM